MGVGAHALDELDGRPLGTGIPSRILVALAVASVGAAAAIGIAVALERTLWILPLVAVGVLLVPAYNLALFGGRVHTDVGFALAWGAFPLLTAFVAQTGTSASRPCSPRPGPRSSRSPSATSRTSCGGCAARSSPSRARSSCTTGRPSL